MAFCAKCGNQLDTDTRFCDKCGQAVDGVNVAPIAQPPTYSAQAATSAPPAQAVKPLRTKKPKGMVSKIFGVLLMAAVIVLLNYFGIPGYIAALVLGIWGGGALLGKNQNGKLHEKLALLGAALLGTATYCFAGLRFGAYAGALVFIGVGLGLTRLYKQKPDMKTWLLEIAPAVLYLSLFERVGGAVSKVPGILDGAPVGVIARYIEAALLLVAFIVLQSLHNKQPMENMRDRTIPKHRKLRNFSKFLIVAALLLVWFNPFGVLAFDNIKSNVWDWLDGFGEGKSVVTTISNTNGTSLLMVKGAGSVTSEAAALELLSQYDKELGGEYAFVDSVALSNGNTLYRFAQVIKNIAVDGGAKNLVVDASGNPLYVVGQTKIISKDLSKPQNSLNDSQAKKALQELFDGLDASIETLEQVWYFADNMEQSSYQLAYKANLSFEDEAEERSTCSAVLDAVTGDILDISFEDEGYAAVLQDAKLSGTFENADFEAITKAADQIMFGTQMNAWRYRDVLEQECLSFYAHKGNDKLGKSNAAAFVKAFANAGAKGANVDEGVVKVDLKSSRVTLKGTINFPYNADDIIVTQDSGMAQGFTIKTAVPITLVVQNTKGEHILTLPVFDMETFELYPANEEEQYVFTIQGGSRFQSTAKTSFAPVLPGMIMAQAADDIDMRWLEGEVNASYNLTIEQLRDGGGERNASNANQLLRKVEKAYNDGNGARYVALYRFDHLSKQAQEIYEPMAEFGPSGAALSKLYTSFSSTRWFSTVAQTLLVSYRAANKMIAPMWKGIMATTAKQTGGYTLISDDEIDKMVSDAPDKTAIALTLFMLNGKLDYFEAMTNPRHEKFGLLTRLDGTKLSLRKISQTGDEVTVNATITRNGVPIISEPLSILIQNFGDATGGGPADLGPDAAWFTNIVNNMKNTFTRGTFLGFDMERTFDLWFDSIETTDKSPGGNGGNEQEPEEKVKITTPPENEDDLLINENLVRAFSKGLSFYRWIAYQSACVSEDAYVYGPSKTLEELGFTQLKPYKSNGIGIQVVCGVKDVSNAKGKIKKVFAISFRGTEVNEPLNLIADAAIKPKMFKNYGNAHGGFVDCYTEFVMNILPSIQKDYPDIFVENPSPSIGIWLSGHSLGGALAELMTLDLVSIEKGFSPNSVLCYGLASPPPASRELFYFAKAKGATARIHKIMNKNDVVPTAGWKAYTLADSSNLYEFMSGKAVPFPPLLDPIALSIYLARYKSIILQNHAIRDTYITHLYMAN